MKNSVLGKGVTVKSCCYFSRSCKRHRHRARTQCHCQPHLGPESMWLRRTQLIGPLKPFRSCILELFCIWLWNRMGAVWSDTLSPVWNIHRFASSSLFPNLCAMGPHSAASFWLMSSIVLFWGINILSALHAVVQPAKIFALLPMG